MSDPQSVEVKSTVTPGWQTSEFWITMVTKLYVFVLAIKGLIPAGIAVLLMSVLAAVYMVLRSVLKMINPKAVVPDLPIMPLTSGFVQTSKGIDQKSGLY